MEVIDTKKWILSILHKNSLNFTFVPINSVLSMENCSVAELLTNTKCRDLVLKTSCTSCTLCSFYLSFLHQPITVSPINFLKFRPGTLTEFVVFLWCLFHSIEMSVIRKVCLYSVSTSAFPRKSMCFHCYSREKIHLVCYIPFLCIINHNNV